MSAFFKVRGERELKKVAVPHRASAIGFILIKLFLFEMLHHIIKQHCNKNTGGDPEAIGQSRWKFLAFRFPDKIVYGEGQNRKAQTKYDLVHCC
jgi:hypothetical protein